MSSYANSGRRTIDAATFLKGKASPLAEGSRDRPGSAESPQGPDASIVRSVATPAPSASGASEPVSEQSPPLIFKDTTPSGIVVEYQSQPKRLYRVNGVEQPSVTSILGVLDKPLQWWGMQTGVRGVIELFDRGVLATIIDWASDEKQKIVLVDGPGHTLATAEGIVSALTANKLTVNHVVGKAADRGTNVHDALEQWARSVGEFFPTPQNFPDEERPYVEGLLGFLDAVQARPVMCEVMVGSIEHGFAGRYDLVLEIEEPREVVVRCGLKRGPKMGTIAPGRFLCDLKTSAGTYKSHHLQLAAYELAAVECGYEATDGQAVIHVTKNGEYEFIFSQATGDQFLAVKSAYDALKELP